MRELWKTELSFHPPCRPPGIRNVGSLRHRRYHPAFMGFAFFNRKNEVPNFTHTLILCIVYILAACIFGVFVIYEEGMDKGLLFFTGFLVEKSLSLDNVFIISLISHRCKFPGCISTAFCSGAFSARWSCAEF